MDTPVSLLERLRRPNQQHAWERFVELYTPLLFAWARQLHLQPHDAADLVQDVFTVLVEQMPGFRYDPARSFRAWLRTVLLNKWRNRQRRPDPASLPNGGAALPDLHPPDADFDEVAYRRHLVGQALALMQAEFEPTTWRACWEFVVSGRSAAAVAEELGISVNAVYLAKSRVLRRLRQELSGLV